LISYKQRSRFIFFRSSGFSFKEIKQKKININSRRARKKKEKETDVGLKQTINSCQETNKRSAADNYFISLSISVTRERSVNYFSLLEAKKS
jgi:hypothetical protein